MHAILTKRIEIPWKRVLKGVAAFLALPSWVFLVGAILLWSRIGSHEIQFWVSAGICWLSSSVAFLIFIRVRDDSGDTESGRFWILCSGFPIVLVPLLVGVNIIYGLFYVATHLSGMHDSL